MQSFPSLESVGCSDLARSELKWLLISSQMKDWLLGRTRPDTEIIPETNTAPDCALPAAITAPRSGVA